MINAIQNNGFTAEKTLFNNFAVSYQGTEIAYIKERENGLWQCICFIYYPSSFGQITFNNSIDRVIEILKSSVTINFREEQLALF